MKRSIHHAAASLVLLATLTLSAEEPTKNGVGNDAGRSSYLLMKRTNFHVGNKEFAITSDITGSFSQADGTLFVDVDKAILTRHKAEITAKRLYPMTGFRAILCSRTPDGKMWQPVVKSEVVSLKDIKETNHQIVLNRLRLEIPLTGLPPAQLEKCWLGFEIADAVPQDGGGTLEGFCFAHSATFLNGKPTGFFK